MTCMRKLEKYPVSTGWFQKKGNPLLAAILKYFLEVINLSVYVFSKFILLKCNFPPNLFKKLTFSGKKYIFLRYRGLIWKDESTVARFLSEHGVYQFLIA